MIQTISKSRENRTARWPLRRRLTGVALLAAVASLPAPAWSELSPEEQARLAAADEGDQPVATLGLPFEDPFDGNNPARHWRVLNEDKDRYVVEDGEVLAFTTGGQDRFTVDDGKNVFELQALPPDGDFDMSLAGRIEAKTGYEEVWLGQRADTGNYVAAHLYIYTKGCGPALYLRVVANQPLEPGGEPVETDSGFNLFDGPLFKHLCSKAGRALRDKILAKLASDGFELTLSKRGLRYQAAVRLELPARGEQQPAGSETVRTRWVARAAPFGKPAFMLGQWPRAGEGESLVRFDHFSIRPAAQN